MSNKCCFRKNRRQLSIKANSDDDASETYEKFCKVINIVNVLLQSQNITSEFIEQHSIDPSNNDIMESFKEHLLSLIVMSVDLPNVRNSISFNKGQKKSGVNKRSSIDS